MAEFKIDQIEENFSLLEKYYPKVEEGMSKNERKLFRHISVYRDKNIDILSNPYPLSYPIFTPDDYTILLDCCNVDKKEAIKDFLNADIPDNINKPPTNYSTFPMLVIMLLRYYMNKKDTPRVEMMCQYFSYSIYWVIFNKYFKKFPPREETMAYTINDMSNKFKIKQYGSIDMLLKMSIISTIESNKERIMRCTNSEIFYVANLCTNQLNSMMRAITDKYMENYKNNKVVLTGVDQTEDGMNRTSVSISSDVEQLSEEFTNKFFRVEPNRDLINNIAKIRNISSNELKNTITMIIDKQDIEEVKSFYRSIFLLFLSEGDNKTQSDVRSIGFLASMESIYKKGNSNNKNIINIKDTMNKWLLDGSLTYRSSNRPATLNEFKKAVYYYFVFLAASNK